MVNIVSVCHLVFYMTFNIKWLKFTLRDNNFCASYKMCFGPAFTCKWSYNFFFKFLNTRIIQMSHIWDVHRKQWHSRPDKLITYGGQHSIFYNGHASICQTFNKCIYSIQSNLDFSNSNNSNTTDSLNNFLSSAIHIICSQ